MTDHPVVVVDHPIASKSKEQIQLLARASAEEVARSLVDSHSGGKPWLTGSTYNCGPGF